MIGRGIVTLASALLAGALVAVCTGAAEGSAAPSATVVKVAFNKTLKKSIVVDARGKTLYMFTADTGGTPNCTAALDPTCPKLWPPLRASGQLRAGNGIIASKLTTVRRSDNGVTQVVYNRHPLYYFSGCCGYSPGDRKPGDIRGHRFLQLWWVLSPKGTPIRK